MPPHLLTNFELQNYYQNEPIFNGVYSKHNLPKRIKNGTYMINLDEYIDFGTHWICLYNSNIGINYFTALELKMFLKKSKNLLALKT